MLSAFSASLSDAIFSCYEKKVLAAAGTEKLYEPAAAPLNWQDLLQQFTSSLPKSDTQAVMEFAETHSDIVVMAYAG